MWFAAGIRHPLPIGGVGFNFMPSWWYRHYGIEFGERMVFDPDYRVATHVTMRRLLHERFGALGLGEADPTPCVVPPDWQNAVTAALVGAPVVYPPDNYPIAGRLAPDRLEALAVPDPLWAAFPYCEIARQVRHLNGRLGADARPSIPIRGVLNEAVILRGDSFLAELLVEPDRAERLLGFSRDLIVRQLQVNAGGCMVTNCTVPLVGPRTYRDRVLPHDRRVAAECRRQGGGFSIHHCGDLDPYVAMYRGLTPAVAMLDIGPRSDLGQVLEVFPEAERVSQIVDARLMNAGTPAAVGAWIDQRLDAARGHWHRLSLNVADIEYGAPDDSLAAVYEHVRRAA
jgi:hypothetical protein